MASSVMEFGIGDQGRQKKSSWPLDAKVTRHASKNAGFCYTGEGYKVKCEDCNAKVQIDVCVPSVQLVKQHKNDCKFLKEKFPQINRFSGILLQSQSERLKTFEGWPLDFISPEKLAEAGLFYLKVADHTQCIFCRGKIGKWEVGDDPMTEHRRHFPTCPFVEKQM